MAHSLIAGVRRVYSMAAFYTLVTSMEALVPFILTPVLTRVLTPGAFGTWTIFVSLMTVFRPVVTASFNEAIRMHFFKLRPGQHSGFISSAILLSIVITMLLICLFFFFSQPFIEFFQMPGNWLIAVFVGALLYGIFYFLLAFNQFSNDRKNFALLHVTQSVISVVAILGFVFSGQGWEGAIMGKIIGLGGALAIGLLWLTPLLDTGELAKPKKEHLPELARFGVLYLPTGVGLVLAGITDRLIIAHEMDASHVGFYGAAELFGAVLALAVTGFLHGWMPWLFRRLEEAEGRATKEILLVSLVFFALLPVGAVVIYGASLIGAPLLLGASFQSAIDLIPWAIGAMATRAIFSHNQAFLHYKAKVAMMSISSLAFFLLNILFTFWLIVDYGVPGVFAATCAAYGVATVINSLFVFQCYRLPRES
ncbi:MAG: lipopolysaccharide biosynthesis protein [Magnetospiraceae bacterium]